MKTIKNKKEKTISLPKAQSDDLLKMAVTTFLLIGGAWLVLKISREMLKELEAMGL